ncbi:MAG: LysR family transcriptional regulator [Alphaproteobacteria bacterium]|nr:LysR family transcriptional regulator [Alphaproteobacteria bacterium]
MDLDLYRCLVTTVDHGSITAAAAALGLSRPTLSRRLSELEAHLGLALLHRTTRRVEPTPAGRRLVDQLRPVLQDLARIEQSALEERDEVSGVLRTSVPPVLAPDIVRLVVQLQQEHPRLEVELLADIRWAELRGDRVEVAVRAGRVGDPDLIRRRLGASEISAVAAPDYLARRGTPARVEDLADHRLLRVHGPEGTPMLWWPLRSGGRVPVSGAFSSNDQRALLEAALAGGGIALVSESSSAQALARGLLVRVLPDQIGVRLPLHAVYARRKLQPARVRVFVDGLVRWFEDREPGALAQHP